MDQQKLRTLVFEKTGVRIDIDDPVFALVALNEAVLAEAVERHVARIDAASAELAGQLGSLRQSGSVCQFSGGPDAAPGPVSAAAPGMLPPQLLALAAGAAILCAVLVLIGQALFFSPPAPSAALTLEQARALEQSDKLKRAIDKLDPATRKAITAAMQ